MMDRSLKPSGSADTGDRPGSQACQTVATTAPPGDANGCSRSAGFLAGPGGYGSSPRLGDTGTTIDLGRILRAVRVGNRARLDRSAREYTGGQAAEADRLCCGGHGVFGCCSSRPADLLDKSRERTVACLAMDRGLRLRHGQRDSRGYAGFALQFGISELACNQANCGGRPVWRGRGCCDQCLLADWMLRFDSGACAGSAWNTDYRHDARRSPHRTCLRSPGIV